VQAVGFRIESDLLMRFEAWEELGERLNTGSQRNHQTDKKKKPHHRALNLEARKAKARRWIWLRAMRAATLRSLP
jgi:hypothetical protein